MNTLHRRRLIGSLAAGAGLVAAPGLVRARQLGPLPRATPQQTEGPFYPYQPSTAVDADLVRLTGLDADAMGEVTWMSGRAQDRFGNPVRDALVEIWQCDANGRYRHPDDTAPATPDLRFQGYGRTMTDGDGGFRFRTIKPVAYDVPIPGQILRRAPHIHLALSTRGVRRLTTQLYVEGDPLNDTDIVLNDIATPEQRAGVIRPYRSGAPEEPTALHVRYDLIVEL